MSRQRVTGNGKVLPNWSSFLRDNDNKTELIHFLADKIYEMDTSNIVIVAKGETAINNQMISLDEAAPCTHEEADIWLFVNARHSAAEGIKVFKISANDTDVIVIAISALPFMKDLGLQQLWIAFDQGRYRRLIPIHDLKIGREKIKSMLFFYAFSG